MKSGIMRRALLCAGCVITVVDRYLLWIQSCPCNAEQIKSNPSWLDSVILLIIDIKSQWRMGKCSIAAVNEAVVLILHSRMWMIITTLSNIALLQSTYWFMPLYFMAYNQYVIRHRVYGTYHLNGFKAQRIETMLCVYAISPMSIPGFSEPLEARVIVIGLHCHITHPSSPQFTIGYLNTAVDNQLQSYAMWVQRCKTRTNEGRSDTPAPK